MLISNPSFMSGDFIPVMIVKTRYFLNNSADLRLDYVKTQKPLLDLLSAGPQLNRPRLLKYVVVLEQILF
jgi:hypothetical protein